MRGLLVLAGMISLAQTGVETNPLAKKLVQQGIDIATVGKVRLSEPAMRSGMTAAEQTALLKKLAPTGYDNFIRNRDTAPHALKFNDIVGPNQKRRGQGVALWFVVHATLKQATDAEALDRFLGTNGQAEGTLLKAADLKKRGIALDKNLDERYSKVQFKILDKVQVSGVSRSVKTSGPDFLVSAMYLDERFSKDPDFPNQWRPIDKKKGPGMPSPYEGFAGYVKITELKEPAGALLVEFHLVLNEPIGWFNGRPLIRSKLPLVLQDRVRSFRRSLKN
jgi:hypothetical protein